MTVTTRARRPDDDFEALNEGNPLAWHLPFWKQLEDEGGLEVLWFVGELDGQPAGYAVAAPRPIAAGGTGPALLNVVPGSRRQGVATALRARLEDAVRGRVPGIMLTYLEGADEAERTARAWGVEEVAHHQESVLDLLAIDRDDFASRAVVGGVEIRPLGDPAALDEDDWRDLHEFAQARFREAPDSADGGGELPIEVLRLQVQEPWSLFEALVDGERVGVTWVMPRPAVDNATNTFFTGVTEAVRGRGVAVALKCAQALAMADVGIEKLYTQNMGGNAPILAANERLGFVRDSGYVDVLLPVD
jgi:GNAT superfamily N-acetyltransferase